MPDRPEDPLAYRVFNEIAIINQLSSAAFKDVLPPPLNQSMFGVLNHLVRMGDGKTPGDLARLFQVTRPSMTNIIGKLEAAAFVAVEPDGQDGRAKRVFITQQGRAARDNAVKSTEALFAELGPKLAGLNLDELAQSLGELRAILDSERD